MKLEYYKKDSNDLILFLNGWGCDAKQLSTLDYKSNLLVVSDYRDLNLDFDFSKFKNIDLIAYSCGVMMSKMLEDKLPLFRKKLAINGTPKLFNPIFGLSKETLQAFYDIDKYNYLEFRLKYLVANKPELALFNKYQPNRSIEDCIEELDKLVKCYYPIVKDCFDFDKVLLAEKDTIIPIEKQLKYWKTKQTETEIKIIKNEAHFPFFIFKSFEELFEY